MAFQVADSVALVTGANRGIGEGFVRVLLERGAAKVYATARDPANLDPLVALAPDRVVPLRLDIGAAEQRQAAAEAAQDLTLLINNAGIPGDLENPMERRFIAASSLEDARRVFEIDFWAPLELTRLFAPILAKNGGGAVLTVQSIGALFSLAEFGSYCAAKAAGGIAMGCVRNELWEQGTFVANIFTAGVRTRMSHQPEDVPIMSPEDHAREVFDAADAGIDDIYSGTGGTAMRDQIRNDPEGFKAQWRERFLNSPLGQ